MDLSVIIVNFNTRDLLLECIKSIKKETRRISYEIIVSDNDSKDGSVEAVRKHIPDVVVLENTQNLGFAKANNIGIDKSNGRYICLMNTDIVVRDGCLDKMVAFMDKNSDTGALAPLTVDGDGHIRYNCRKFPNLWNCFCDAFFISSLFKNVSFFSGRTLPSVSYNKLHDAHVLSGCFLMVSKLAVDKVGKLDERFFFYAEDTDWCKRIHDAGWRIVYHAGLKSVHYGGGSSKAQPKKFFIQLVRADYQYWKKHFSPPIVVIYALLISTQLTLRALYYGISVRVTHREEVKRKYHNNLAGLRWLLFNRI